MFYQLKVWLGIWLIYSFVLHDGVANNYDNLFLKSKKETKSNMGFDRGLRTAYNIVVVWNVKAQYSRKK